MSFNTSWRLSSSLVALLAILATTAFATQITYDGRDGDVGHMKDIMMDYGEGETEISCMLANVPNDVTVSKDDVRIVSDTGVETGDIVVADNGGGFYNVTVGLHMKGFGGGKKQVKVDVAINDERIWLMGFLGCMGIEVGDAGVVGESGTGVQFKSWKDAEEGKKLKVKGWGKGGEALPVGEIESGTKVDIRDGKGIVEKDDVTFRDGSMSFRPQKYRVGGPVVIRIVVETIEKDGEVFETVIVLNVGEDVPAPPVVMGPVTLDVDTSKESDVTLNCFNMKTKSRKMTEMTMKVGDMTFEMDSKSSDMGDETQKIKLVADEQPKMKDGEYTPKLTAKFDDGSSEEVIQDGKVEVKLRNRANLVEGTDAEASPEPSSNAAVLGGAIGGAAGGVFIIGALILGAWWYSSRRSAADESSYSSSGPIGVPDAVNPANNGIARDIYARGELHLSPNGDNCSIIDENGERHVFGRSPSSNGRSSFVSSKYSV